MCVCMHFPMSIAFTLLFCFCDQNTARQPPTFNVVRRQLHALLYLYIHVHCTYKHIIHTCTKRTWKNREQAGRQAATEAIVIAEGNWHCKSSCGQCVYSYDISLPMCIIITHCQHLLFLDCYFFFFFVVAFVVAVILFCCCYYIRQFTRRMNYRESLFILLLLLLPLLLLQ